MEGAVTRPAPICTDASGNIRESRGGQDLHASPLLRDSCGQETARWGTMLHEAGQIWSAFVVQSGHLASAEPDSSIRLHRFVWLERVCGCHAVDVKLTDLTFIDYLNAEACYQGFLRTRNPDRLRELGRILYRDGEDNAPKRFEPDMVERLGCFCWFTYAKAEFARQFPHFFKPVPNGGGEADFLKLVNAQIRALTGGDVTKEKEIEQIPCWRALTELNEKAREAEEFNAKYG